VGRKTQSAFLSLILAQAVHSVEEYVRRFFAVFPPARFVSSLFSNDISRGFAIENVVLSGSVCAEQFLCGRNGARLGA
jgi:hypothetical protein